MSDPHTAVVFRRRDAALKAAQLRTFAQSLARCLAGARPFTCLITGDDDLRRLHREFLGKDSPTDVLSFPSGDEAGLLGDLAISLDRARAQAAERNHSLADEVRILMLHGLLHLLGYDHETDCGEMRRLENRLRRRMRLPHGLIERSQR